MRVSRSTNGGKKHFSDRFAVKEFNSVIFPIHLFGIPCDMDTILALARRKNILVIEDAAPAMGAEYHHRLVGTFGDAAVISFQSTKIISAETGGAILTDDAVFARKIEDILKIQARPVSSILLSLSMIARKLSTTPWMYPFASRVYSLYRREMMYEILSPRNSPPSGYLGRCSPFSIRLILQQWDRLFWNLARRRWIAAKYRSALEGHPAFQLPTVPAETNPAWIQYPLIVQNKQRFYSFMRNAGIDVTWTYRYSCAAMFSQPGFPMAEQAARSIISLPVYPTLNDVDVERICEVANRYSG